MWAKSTLLMVFLLCVCLCDDGAHAFLLSSLRTRRGLPAPGASFTSPTVEEVATVERQEKVTDSDNDGKLSWQWKKVAEAAFAESDSPIVLFDGVCNFCSASVNLCLDLDEDEVLRFCSLQSKTGQALLLQNGRRHDDMSSMVLVENGKKKKAYFESDAVLRVAEKLTGLPPLVRSAAIVARATIPPVFRDFVYEFISEHRYFWGSREEDGPTCRMDFDGTLQARFVQDPVDAWDEKDVL